MKIHLMFLFRGLTLVAAVLPLVNCASSGSGAAYAPSAPAPLSASEANSVMAPSAPTDRGLRFGSDAISRNAIDALISGDTPSGTSTVSPGLLKKKSSRQGLATKAGDESYSVMTETPFYRKTTGQPDAVDSFHYNDETGAKAMADALGGGSKRRGTFSAARGRLEVALKGSYSGPYERYEAGGKRIVIGSPGSSFEILLSNRTKHAVEVVASVDSLDVMDGKSASVKKRGYVIPAKGDLTIDGFRVNAQTVKRFMFGSVDDSAAAKAGAARNVGVIGLAVYDEDEAQAKLARLVEAQKRSAADPFAASMR